MALSPKPFFRAFGPFDISAYSSKASLTAWENFAELYSFKAFSNSVLDGVRRVTHLLDAFLDRMERTADLFEAILAASKLPTCLRCSQMASWTLTEYAGQHTCWTHLWTGHRTADSVDKMLEAAPADSLLVAALERSSREQLSSRAPEAAGRPHPPPREGIRGREGESPRCLRLPAPGVLLQQLLFAASS